jgi:hypothetical protein
MGKDYLYIIIDGNNAFGIWRTGKLVGITEKGQGTYWDIDYLSSLSYADIHKYYLKQGYPNTSIISMNDKKIASVPKILLNAVAKINERVNNPNECIMARNYYFIQVGDVSPEIQTLKADTSDSEYNEMLDYFWSKMKETSKIPSERFDK